MGFVAYTRVSKIATSCLLQVRFVCLFGGRVVLWLCPGLLFRLRSITEAGTGVRILQTRCGVHLQPVAEVVPVAFGLLPQVSFVEVLAEQQIVVVAGQMPD